MQKLLIQTSVRQNSWTNWTRDTLLLLVGSLIAALAVNVFYVPVRLTMGGLSGIASIIYQMTGKGEFLSFGVIVLLLNIPLLILGYFIISFNFVWRSIVGTIVYSLTIDLTAPFLTNWFTSYINRPLQNGSPDPLIYCLFGGVLYGIGLGMIFRGGFTTGGTDILALVIKK